MDVETCKPLLSLISQFAIESKVDGLIIFLVLVVKVNGMLNYTTEVFFGFFRIRGSQPLIVLDFVTFEISSLSPLFEFRDGEEGFHIIAFGAFDDWCHKFFDEAIVDDERRPEVMDEVDDQTLNVRTIMILISHDHH